MDAGARATEGNQFCWLLLKEGLARRLAKKGRGGEGREGGRGKEGGEEEEVQEEKKQVADCLVDHMMGTPSGVLVMLGFPSAVL